MDVRTLCLGILSLGDASGYEIKKKLEDGYSHFYDASYGSIYPALNKLQREDLVSCIYESQNNRPDKKVYGLTTDGRLALVRELSSTPGKDRVRSEFLVTLLFSDLLDVAHIANIIDAKISEYEDCIEGIEQRYDETAAPSDRFVGGYGLAVYGAALKYIQESRHLVEGEALMAQVRKDQINGSEAAD